MEPTQTKLPAQIQVKAQHTAKVALNCTANRREAILWLERDLAVQVAEFEKTPSFRTYLDAMTCWEHNKNRYQKGHSTRPPGPEPKLPHYARSIVIVRAAIELLHQGHTP